MAAIITKPKNGGKERSGIGKFFLGKQEKILQAPLYDKETEGAIAQARKLGLEGLQANQNKPLGNPTQLAAGFQPIAQQARNNFGQYGIPGIAERFTGNNAQNSSAFQQSLGGAAGDLESNLAALGSQYGVNQQAAQLQHQGMQQAHFGNLFNMGLRPTFENNYQAETPGFLENVANALPSLGLAYATGGGSTIMNGLNNLLGRNQQQVAPSNQMGNAPAIQPTQFQQPQAPAQNFQQQPIQNQQSSFGNQFENAPLTNWLRAQSGQNNYQSDATQAGNRNQNDPLNPTTLNLLRLLSRQGQG